MYTFSFTVGSIIPKSVKCIHSATKSRLDDSRVLGSVALQFRVGDSTHRLHSSSFLGAPYRILNMNHKKELLWSLWVGIWDAGSYIKHQ